MRDFIRLLINGREHRIQGGQAFTTLADYLRSLPGHTGTKIVCAEGDCGACSVLVRRGDGEFVPVNSCIQSLFQLDETSIVTVEGLAPAGNGGEGPVSTGAAVQSSMIESHGAQCGYCTPGFVVAMTALFEGHDRVSERDVREGLTGNLCRCTGYEPIIKAACAVDAGHSRRMREIYPGMAADGEAVSITAGGRNFFAPASLGDAIAYRAENPGCTIVQGGTDVGVWINKRSWSTPAMLSLAKIPGLGSIAEVDGTIQVGANVTLSELDAFIRTRIPELHEILSLFGSPQIRNAGTLVGNIANGSPIADTLPYLFVAGATLRLEGTRGPREVPIASFYLGYKKFDLRADEIITAVRVPRAGAGAAGGQGEILKLYKVSRRRDLDISAFTAAIRLQTREQHVETATVAYGGVAPIVMRLPKTESFLAGRPLTIETFREAGAIARGEVAPISDVRGSRDYRLQLAENILLKFYFEAVHRKDTGTGPDSQVPGSPAGAAGPASVHGEAR